MTTINIELTTLVEIIVEISANNTKKVVSAYSEESDKVFFRDELDFPDVEKISDLIKSIPHDIRCTIEVEEIDQDKGSRGKRLWNGGRVRGN